MNLNKYQTAMFGNVKNILSALISVNTPEEIILSEMNKWKKDFESKVPGSRLRISAGKNPGIEITDCSRDSAKTSRDSSQYLTLRARIQNTRLTAIVGNKDGSTENSVIAESLRELAALIDRLPVELKDHEALDMFEMLGIEGSTELDDEDDDGQEQGSDEEVAQDAVQESEETAHAEANEVIQYADADHDDIHQSGEAHLKKDGIVELVQVDGELLD